MEGEKSNSIEEDELEEEESRALVLRGLILKRRKPNGYYPPDFCSNFFLSSIDDGPRIGREAMDSEYNKLWKKTIVEEMDGLNEVWDLVELFSRRKPIGSKWIIKQKLNGEDKMEGIDFGDIFFFLLFLN